MTFEISDKSLDQISSDAAIVFAFQGKDNFELLNSSKKLDDSLSGKVSKYLKLENFSGKKGDKLRIFTDGQILPSRIVVMGLGKKEDFISDDLRKAIGSLSKNVRNKYDSMSIALSEELGTNLAHVSQVLVEGIMLGTYTFNKYQEKEDKKERDFSAVTFSVDSSNEKEVKRGIALGKLYSDATNLSRDLVNEQAAIATPTFLANLALDIAKKDPKHISLKVFDRQQIAKMGMNAFLGIARGADTPPKFIFLEYKPGNPSTGSGQEKLAIVGKGITFDSGGINVKPGDHMSDMKMDMAGASIVLAVFSVISEIKPDFGVIGLIAATPNLISGSSIVPGDVVKAMNGKTIEVLNTDAEGRVTMADSLSFAVQEKATTIIDFATLTGAAMVALGDEITALFSNDEKLASKIKSAAFESGEKVWELPLEKDYKDLNKSSVADIANIPSSRYGGSISAALFLQEFVGKTKWAHLDIAGPAFSSKGTPIGPKGGTGHGVRTVLNFLSK